MRVEQSQQAELITAQAGLGTSAAKQATQELVRRPSSPRRRRRRRTTGTERQQHDRPRRPKAGAKAIPKGPKGETTQAVKDHPAYVEVTAGPRNGMFINMTNNERRGEAFTLSARTTATCTSTARARTAG